MDWNEVPIRVIPIKALVWPTHGIDPAELVPGGTRRHPRDGEPIHVEVLQGAPGRFFVHDGRHRAIRARESGKKMIVARVLD